MRILTFLFSLIWAGVSTSSAFAQDMNAECMALGRAPGSAESRLVALADAPTRINAASVVPAAADLPAYCKVEGIVAPTNRFELRLPISNWNGKFLMSGCGGPCGNIGFDRAATALARNYAVVATDMGHSGAGWLFAYNNLQGEIDFGYRATHVVSIAAKEIIDVFYKKRANRSYFAGCSTGGRQAMMEAQRFPEDFNAIAAGAPVWDETGDATLYVVWNALANLDKSTGKAILDPKKLTLINQAVMKKCDKLDGLEDNLLQDPRGCDWQPREIACGGGSSGDTCLSAAEVGVVEKLYTGAVNAKGDRWYFGLSRGSEYTWTPEFIGANGRRGSRIDGPQSGMEEFTQLMPFFYDRPLGTPVTDFDFDRDPPRRQMMEIIYNVQNPDLRRFKKLGGKLILYHGWDDDSIPPGASVDYYETATATMGGAAATRDFFRLFVVPGMTHCAGGTGGGEVDFLTALEAWDEKNQAPDQLMVYRLVNDRSGPPPIHPLAPSQYDRSRPVFAYPDVARYKGKGDPMQAANWEKAPRRN